MILKNNFLINHNHVSFVVFTLAILFINAYDELVSLMVPEIVVPLKHMVNCEVARNSETYLHDFLEICF